MIETPRVSWVLVTVFLAALVAAIWIAAMPREAAIAIRASERGVIFAPPAPAPALERDMEREIEAASATVRDFARRRPLPR